MCAKAEVSCASKVFQGMGLAHLSLRTEISVFDNLLGNVSCYENKVGLLLPSVVPNSLSCLYRANLSHL